MSRSKHRPHWNKTAGHGFFKKMLNRDVRRVPKDEKPIIKKRGYG